ncbi:hypothetical protein HMPREF9582_02058 [Cutibacterium acnes HL060PA1]|nr:hypothetical protein HMPREF9603_00675 [Cutibacterium acnes HL001PA1]EFT10156.1 hypothetical protein HMPREF9619_01361 [Cutibacterium acnes HL082PA2]EFT25983.1 hypothetical protein HMPREF9577_01403 [Cutibacterium acnes HL110PA3]EFT62730.1 hypothetical protein HMPREF9578_02009 [Cutibacterium acnes HL110PA4]EFT66979.1 hypothetical protein HMPREF9582_02058 [Cutibacterium acnes HL060PA1]EFT76204.1 hypothetical protein HMPREF9599_02492 [Cutibacterium acnes HL050PA2]
MFDARCAVGESNRNALLTSVRSPLVDHRSTWWWITCLGFAGLTMVPITKVRRS